MPHLPKNRIPTVTIQAIFFKLQKPAKTIANKGENPAPNLHPKNLPLVTGNFFFIHHSTFFIHPTPRPLGHPQSRRP